MRFSDYKNPGNYESQNLKANRTRIAEILEQGKRKIALHDEKMKRLNFNNSLQWLNQRPEIIKDLVKN